MITIAKMGRPSIQIDKKQFESLCSMMCTENEIAYWFKCSIDTINNWCKKEYSETFSDTYKKLSTGGKVSLRRNQFELSKKSAAMAIFLGQQYLGQRNYAVIEAKQEINIVEDDPLSKAIQGLMKNDKPKTT